jgi:hypothetical protein
MKLIIAIDLPDDSVSLAAAIEDQVTECVQRFSASARDGFGVYGVRLVTDQRYAEFRDRLRGREPSSASEWIRWFEHGGTREDGD